MIGNIEQKIIDLINEASESGSLGYKFKKVESYKSDLDDNISTVLKDMPAVLVSYTGDTEEEQNRGDLITAKFMLTIFNKDLRNEATSRKGGLNKTGIYQMLSDIKFLLRGKELELGGIYDPAFPIVIKNTRPIFTGNLSNYHTSIFAIDIEVTYIEPRIESAEDAVSYENLADFNRLNTTWQVPETGITTNTNLNLNQGE